jgi:hypothetical protein
MGHSSGTPMKSGMSSRSVGGSIAVSFTLSVRAERRGRSEGSHRWSINEVTKAT